MRVKGNFAVLFKHFYLQNYQNDLVMISEQQITKIITSLVILSMASAFISFSLLFPEYFWTLDSPATWKDKCHFISIMMLVFAFLSIVQWDNQFLGERDVINLGHLPVSKWSILLAKISSNAFFISMYCLGASFFSGIVFSVMLTHLQPGFIVGSRYMFAHLLSVFLGGMFVYYLFSLIQLILMISLPLNWMKRAGAYIQFALILFSLTYFTFIGSSMNFLAEWIKHSDNKIFAFPSIWFTGMYQWIIGYHSPLNYRLTQIGMVAMALLWGIHSLMIYLRYRQHFHGMNDKGKLVAPPNKITSYLNRLIYHRQQEKAVSGYLASTMERSSMHRLRASAVLATGTSIAAIVITKGVSIGTGPLKTILMMAPLHIVLLACIVGVRSIIELPMELECNWIFRITANDDLAIYRSATRKYVMMRFIFPIMILGIVLYWIICGMQFAILHAVFAVLIAWIVTHAIFHKNRKIPFTCSYLPGKLNLKVFIGPYILAFVTYVGLVSLYEFICFISPLAYIINILGMIAVGMFFEKIFTQEVNDEPQFLEEPMPVMLSINTDN